VRGVLNKMPREDCWNCARQIHGVSTTFWPANERYHRGVLTINAPEVCIPCFHQLEAFEEAEREGWRFTSIDFESPCVCGKPSVCAIRGNHCVECWRADRMLSRLQSMHRRTAKVLRLLKQEVAGA